MRGPSVLSHSRTASDAAALLPGTSASQPMIAARSASAICGEKIRGGKHNRRVTLQPIYFNVIHLKIRRIRGATDGETSPIWGRLVVAYTLRIGRSPYQPGSGSGLLRLCLVRAKNSVAALPGRASALRAGRTNHRVRDPVWTSSSGQPPSIPRLRFDCAYRGSRLRQKLREYYASTRDRADSFVIEIPQRSYALSIGVPVAGANARRKPPRKPPAHVSGSAAPYKVCSRPAWRRLASW